MVGRQVGDVEFECLSQVVDPFIKTHLRDAVDQIDRQVVEAGGVGVVDGPDR